MPSLLWEKGTQAGEIICQACVHGCHLKNGARGRCGVRVNKNGELLSMVENLVSSAQLDPVEKKPLYHFLPGSKAFSIGSIGCNFRCDFCQNHHISTIPKDGIVPGKRTTPKSIVDMAVNHHAASVAFTYNEPTVFPELINDTATMAKSRGLHVILVSNGFMSEQFRSLLRNKVDAVNVDLKSFSENFYKTYCGGHLEPVLENLKAIHKLGWWLEVTTLVIPGLNDSDAELANCARFIHDELGADVPWHLTAFHGAHKMASHSSTSLDRLESAWRIGKSAGLHFVYLGNVVSAVGSNTWCPSCGALVVERLPWKTVQPSVGRCPGCGSSIAGVWR